MTESVPTPRPNEIEALIRNAKSKNYLVEIRQRTISCTTKHFEIYFVLGQEYVSISRCDPIKVITVVQRSIDSPAVRESVLVEKNNVRSIVADTFLGEIPRLLGGSQFGADDRSICMQVPLSKLSELMNAIERIETFNPEALAASIEHLARKELTAILGTPAGM